MADLRTLLCIVFLDGFDTAAIGYIAPALVSEWAVELPALAPVLTAALFGLSTGAFFAGPLGDRFGRKMVLVGSVFVFGTACLASAFSGDLVQLIIWRFITGLGLGAAMPNAVTGLSQGTAAVITALFALGGVSAILSGWLMDRFSAAQSDCSDLLCTDCTRRMVYRSNWQPCCASRVSGAHSRCIAQHGTNLAAFPRSCLLSHSGTSNRGGVDDGAWTLRRHCRLFYCR